MLFPIFIYYLHALYFFDYNILYYYAFFLKKYYFTNACYYHWY